MSFGKDKGAAKRAERHEVSILVLMDVVREDLTPEGVHHVLPCFNPCSNGCRSGRPPCAGRRFISVSVSILVLMDVVREDLPGGEFGSTDK